MKAQNVITSNKYDVVSVDWLKRATAEENLGKLVDFYPWELHSSNSPTTTRMMENYDCFQDNYTEKADEISLKRSLDKVSELVRFLKKIFIMFSQFFIGFVASYSS